MPDIIKNYWQIVFAITTIVISLAAQWAIYGVRLQSLEDRQDRQGTAIMNLQTEQVDSASQYLALKTKVDLMYDSVIYIRNRIDSAIH